MATASDPYFQQALASAVTSPVVEARSTTAPDTIPATTPLNPTIPEAPESTAPSDTAPNTPASITTSTALDIEEYLDLLETEQDEQDELERYKLDPDRLQRDLEINERVNRSLAEAEESALVREILSPARPERKTVQFASRPDSPTPDGETEDQDVMVRMVHVWNTFRDFVTVRGITGFEEYILEPREAKPLKSSKGVGSGTAERSGNTEGEEKMDDTEKAEAGKEIPSKRSSTPAIPILDTVQSEDGLQSKKKADEVVPLTSTPNISLESSSAEPAAVSPTINVIPPTPLSTPALKRAGLTDVAADKEKPTTAPKSYKVLNGRVIQVDSTSTSFTSPPAASSGWESPIPPAQSKSETWPATISEPSKHLPSAGAPPLDVPKVVEPAPAKNTWDMVSTPRTEISGFRKSLSPEGQKAADEDFLEGLSDSKKVEEKIEEKNVSSKKVVIVDTKPPEQLISPIKASPFPLELPSTSSEPALPKYVPPSADNASFLIPLTPTTARPLTASTELEAKDRESHATPTSAPKVILPAPQSPPAASSAVRMGMPVPVPHPPMPKPDTKAPVRTAIKPTVAPKPTNLAKSAVPPLSRVTAAISPVVGGLVDPFLQNLQPSAKKSIPVSRPKTPRVSLDSTDSTPEKKQLSIQIPLSSSFTESESTSPGSLSSSWTLVENSRKEVPAAPPPTPVRKNWFGTTPTPAATPASTPVVGPSKPPGAPSPTESKPKTQSSGPSGRHLLTIQIPMGNSIIPIRLNERDDPEKVAQEFARERSLETRREGGKRDVEKLVEFFKTEFAKAAKEREEKRAARRERMRSSATEKKD